MNLKFGITVDTTVVTSTYITEEGLPILEVAHEDDEEGGHMWQFHAGNGDYSMERMQLVRLSTILRLDPGLEAMPYVEIGKSARRESVRDPWRIVK